MDVREKQGTSDFASVLICLTHDWQIYNMYLFWALIFIQRLFTLIVSFGFHGLDLQESGTNNYYSLA